MYSKSLFVNILIDRSSAVPLPPRCPCCLHQLSGGFVFVFVFSLAFTNQLTMLPLSFIQSFKTLCMIDAKSGLATFVKIKFNAHKI